MRGNTNQERQKERQRQTLCGKLDKRDSERKTKVDVMWKA